MAIITTITTNGVETGTGQNVAELLADLPITTKQSPFVEDTMKKVSDSLSGMIPLSNDKPDPL